MNDVAEDIRVHNAELLATARPCPFCGGTELSVGWWSDDERGDYDAIECDACLGAAPADKWNLRTGAPS